jgi:hypothetical protein
MKLFNSFGSHAYQRPVWSICILLFVSGCSKMPGNKYLGQKDVPLKYTLIGDTLLPVPSSLEVEDETAEINKNGTVEIELEKDFDRGGVIYSYMCGDGANKHINLTTAKRGFEELDKGSTQRYVRFKGKKALISDFKLSHGGKNTEDHNLVFDYNGKQYYLFMSTFAPTEAARAYSYGMWKKLSDGIVLLERNPGKIECSIKKIDVSSKEIKFEVSIVNKSQEIVKVNRKTLMYAFRRTHLNGLEIQKVYADIPIPYFSPYLSNEYITLKTNKNYIFTDYIHLDEEYINPKLLELFHKPDAPVRLNYKYKTDVVLMRGRSKVLYVQAIANRGVVVATYSDN